MSAAQHRCGPATKVDEALHAELGERAYAGVYAENLPWNDQAWVIKARHHGEVRF